MTSEVQKSTQKPVFPFVHGGITLLLTVILVLVLVVLALLTLSAAKSDWEFSSQIAQNTTAYYTACNQAEETLSQVQAQLAQSSGDSLPDFSQLPVEQAGSKLCWQVPIREGQLLQVEFSLKTEQITQWQVVTTIPWQGNDSVEVMQPQERA